MYEARQDTLDERVGERESPDKMKQKVFRVKKFGRAGPDMGVMPLEMRPWMERVQSVIRDENHWETVTVENGLQVLALEPSNTRFQVDYKILQSLFKFAASVTMLFFLVKWYMVDISVFWLGVIV